MVLLSLTVELLARMATEMVRRRRPFPAETLAGYLMYVRYLLEPGPDSDNPGGIGPALPVPRSIGDEHSPTTDEELGNG